MARNINAVESLVKKNAKLESFLKKCLPLATFEKVRGYESCIVVSEKENKAFKYVVLDDDYIYLTENPPKSVQQAVWLGDVTSVEAVNDLPDFLSGEEKRNSQHIAVSYRTTTPPKQRSLRKARKSHGSYSDITERSNQSTPLSLYNNLADESIVGSLSVHNFSFTNSNHNNSITSIKDGSMLNRKKFSADISDENVLNSLKEELEEGQVSSDDDDLQVSNTSKRLYGSHDTINGFINVSRNNCMQPDTQSIMSRDIGSNRAVRKVPAVSQQPGKAPAFFMPNGETVTEKPRESFWRRICCSCWMSINPNILTNMSKRNSIAPEFNLYQSNNVVSPNADVQLRVNSTGKFTSLSNVSGMMTPRGFNHDSPIPSTPVSSRPPSILSRHNFLSDSRSTLMAPSLPDLTLSNGDLATLVSDRRDAVINIYLLTLNSPMLMLIRSAWCNALMRSTRLLQTSHITHVKSSTNARSGEDRAFLAKLMKYITCEEHDLATLYSLCDQLKMAAEDNMVAKRSFLKNGDIVLFLVRQLQTYMPKSTCDLSKVDGLDTRADELELAILVTDLISLMFRETEIYPFRVHALEGERGRCVLDLFMVLMCQIDVPDATPQMTDNHLLHIDELNKLSCSFTKSAVSCVFELFLMAKQAYWNRSDDNFFNISWIIRVLEELKITEHFIEHLVNDILRVIMPTQTPELEPNDAVYFYKQLFVISTLLEDSRKITAFIRATYREEFKYFIHSASVTRKLPSHYPITSLIVLLVERIKHRVIGVANHAPAKSPQR